MEFSLFALPTYYPEAYGPLGPFYRRLIDFLVSAEELGYDGIWANEHHFHAYGGMIPSPAVLLSALAQRTTRVHLGTSVVVLPLHHPIEVAEQLAMVDLMSGGRLELGVGRGFVPFDYQTLGFTMQEGQDRTKESLEIIVKAFAGEPFRYHGEHFTFDEVQVWPRPERALDGRVWIACSGSPDSFAWTGAMGYNLLTVSSLRPMTELAELVKGYRAALPAAVPTTVLASGPVAGSTSGSASGLASGLVSGSSSDLASGATSGHPSARARYATHFQIVVDEDRARARKIASDAILNYFRLHGEALALSPVTANRPSPAAGFDIDRWVDEGRILAGTPDDVVATMQRARDELGITGMDGTFLFGGIPFETAERSLRLFAEEVIPHLRAPEPVGVR
ncbi:MAG: hypothetical protein QOF51_4251 [Chloroflexota bacterium]|jgi:alkanesulfonate monooxygenase SsuD/methylene tetrahydromethanopterin reductase-like flavin-dependent oxidoreductase (luciferase family)|nr:hypothetical protein [Chloroflexota bacterium]